MPVPGLPRAMASGPPMVVSLGGEIVSPRGALVLVGAPALSMAPPGGAAGALAGAPVAARLVSMKARKPFGNLVASPWYVDDQTAWTPAPMPVPESLRVDGILQCVPFARFLSGIGIFGDAWTWWEKAAGLYARGNHPEPGAVLSFPGTERMPLGHVAVVHQVLTNRKILIDHANWPNASVRHGAISRDIQVVDVSAANDWTDVRVQFGEGGPLGSVYAANGFIYGWSETGVQLARPKFSLDYALWSPAAASWRIFNSINYLWALPAPERAKAYAAAGMVPRDAALASAHGRLGRPALVLGPIGSGVSGSAFSRTLGINRLDVGGGRPLFTVGRFVMR